VSNTVTIKDLVKYIDTTFFEKVEDVAAIKNSVDLFFEMCQKNELIQDEKIAFLMSVIYEKVKEDFKDEESQFIVFTIGVYLGLIMGRHSQKVKINGN
jgi:hypothetical protein